jgi:hypothetical protein
MFRIRIVPTMRVFTYAAIWKKMFWWIPTFVCVYVVVGLCLCAVICLRKFQLYYIPQRGINEVRLF